MAASATANGHITKDTKVSLGVIGTIGALIVGGGISFFIRVGNIETTMVSAVGRFERQFERFGQDLRDIKSEIKDGNADIRKNTVALTELKGRIDAVERRLTVLEKK